MRTTMIRTSRLASLAFYLLAALIFVLGAAHSASAQAPWTNTNTTGGWNQFQTDYAYITKSGTNDTAFYSKYGSTTQEGFWGAAEELEMAEDAYEWDKSQANYNLVVYLVGGFRNLHGDTWTSDNYNDDIIWASLAFIRCYQITGASICLTDAENNYNAVWDRGHDTANNGICQVGTYTAGGACYEDAAVNWNFATVGIQVYNASGFTPYLTEANVVYAFSKANLYVSSGSSIGEIYDAPGVPGVFSYNYGSAIRAAAWEGDTSGIINNVANYVMYDLPDCCTSWQYAGTIDGYNILPNYGQGGNDGGYNGILIRGLMFAYNLGYTMPSSLIPWLQENISEGWSLRNSAGASWNAWTTQTPATDTPLYSWDRTDTLVGMFDVPVPD